MRTLALLAATALAVTVSLSSCNDNKVYDHYEHTPLAGWEKNDRLSFSVPAAKEDGTYTTDIGLRINATYPFMGLTLIVDQHILPTDITISDTLHCDLIDTDGNTRGQGVNFYQYQFHVGEQALHQGDSLQVSVRHDMKREILPGISDIGLIVERE